MNCEEFVIKELEYEREEKSKILEELAQWRSRCTTLQEAINFIAKGVKLEQSQKGDYYVSIASAWEKYEKDAFDRYCAYFDLQKPAPEKEEPEPKKETRAEDVKTEG